MADITLNVSDKQVHELITAEIQKKVVEALGRDGGASLLEKFVVNALNEKHNNYDRETAFGKAVNKMIRKAAEDAVKEWIDENRELLKERITARLQKSPKKFVDAVTDQIIEGLGKSFNVYADLKVVD